MPVREVKLDVNRGGSGMHRNGMPEDMLQSYVDPERITLERARLNRKVNTQGTIRIQWNESLNNVVD